MPSIALVLTLVLTGNPQQDQLLQRGFIPQPTDTQTELFTMISWLGLAAISAIGLLWLARLVREARRTPPATPVWAYRIATTPAHTRRLSRL